MPSPPRSFYVGETVHLGVRVSVPGTRKPVDPEMVTLTSLERDGAPVVPAVTDFTRAAQGDYSLVLPTADLEEGVYDLIVTVADGTAAVVLIPDRFVLKVA